MFISILSLIQQALFNDHTPPYFKVKFTKSEANTLISNGSIIDGDLPVSKLKLVVAWAGIHKEELLIMWV